VCVCVCVCMYVCMYVMCVCMCIYIFVCVCVYVCMYVCTYAFFCVVLSCIGRGFARGQGVLPKCLHGFTVLEVNSELEQAKGPNP